MGGGLHPFSRNIAATEQLKKSERASVPTWRLAFFALQFLLILLVCFRDIFSTFADSPYYFSNIAASLLDSGHCSSCSPVRANIVRDDSGASDYFGLP